MAFLAPFMPYQLRVLTFAISHSLAMLGNRLWGLNPKKHVWPEQFAFHSSQSRQKKQLKLGRKRKSMLCLSSHATPFRCCWTCSLQARYHTPPAPEFSCQTQRVTRLALVSSDHFVPIIPRPKKHDQNAPHYS
jgi:hypothetical protein